MNVLIVDDCELHRRSIRRMLSRLGYVTVSEAASASEAMAAFEATPPDLMILDICLSDRPNDRGGFDVLRRIRAAGWTLPVVIVSSSSQPSDFREAMRDGAQDYVPKDQLCPETLLPTVESFRERSLLRSELERLRARVEHGWGLSAIVGSSAAMDRLRRVIARTAESDNAVLIRGETGSGKEMVARALHQTSTRNAEPFVAVNCSALPGTLIESMMFGHERGAFSGAERRVLGQLELAGAGTILLDEIAEMPVDVQAKLLRVLEDRKFRPLGSELEIPLRARILAATHVDLEQRMAEGRFRADLFYRLDVICIRVPPLAEHRDDVHELLLAFTAELSQNLRFTDRAVDFLAHRAWPGNVRELRNVVARVALLSEENVVDVQQLRELIGGQASDEHTELHRLARAVLALPSNVGSKLSVIERAVLGEAITACGGNKTAAARLIGVDRKLLERHWLRLASGDYGPAADSRPDERSAAEPELSPTRVETG